MHAGQAADDYLADVGAGFDVVGVDAEREGDQFAVLKDA